MEPNPNVVEAFIQLIEAILGNILVAGGGSVLGGGSLLGYMIYNRKKKENGNGKSNGNGNGNGKRKDPAVPESQCSVNRREIYDEFKKVRESQALNQATILGALGKIEGTMEQVTSNVKSLIEKGLQ